jgi:hypothetical protein
MIEGLAVEKRHTRKKFVEEKNLTFFGPHIQLNREGRGTCQNRGCGKPPCASGGRHEDGSPTHANIVFLKLQRWSFIMFMLLVGIASGCKSNPHNVYSRKTRPM